MKIIVTGGAGFIGSNLVHHLLLDPRVNILTIDKLTYAGNIANLSEIMFDERHVFVQEDITHKNKIAKLIQDFKPDLIFHLAAESHVDRSIDCADDFIQTNIVGTYSLLDAAHKYWKSLDAQKKKAFKFVHVSTDEVYGSADHDQHFDESFPYKPNSPYAASKASSDLLVKAYYKTYHFPVIVVNSSNNYGPYQYPEKFIPLCILNALEGKPLPIYGDGLQERDWLYVTDHVRALKMLGIVGNVGENYCVGGNNVMTNMEVIKTVCVLLDELRPNTQFGNHHNLIVHVTDRPGHDRRYATNSEKIKTDVQWQPETLFLEGLRKTVLWYLKNEKWWKVLSSQNDERNRRGLMNEKIVEGT